MPGEPLLAALRLDHRAASRRRRQLVVAILADRDGTARPGQCPADRLGDQPDARACPKIRQISVSALIADTLLRISNEESVSSLFSE